MVKIRLKKSVESYNPEILTSWIFQMKLFLFQFGFYFYTNRKVKEEKWNLNFYHLMKKRSALINNNR